MKFISDPDVWINLDREDLWIYDKLILSKKLGHIAGPAGIPVPAPNFYIVRPITNLRMMSRGAAKVWLTPSTSDQVPDGYFWSQYFEGRHITIDYNYGKQTLAVEGFRNSDRLDRFCRWKKIDNNYDLPDCLVPISKKYEWLNIEMIGDKIIEVHARYNDDFSNHTGQEIIPVWKDEKIDAPANALWYPSACGDRQGFWVIP